MWGRKAKRIKELEGMVGFHQKRDVSNNEISKIRIALIAKKNETITHLETALRDAEEAMDLLRAQPATEVTNEVTAEPLEWIEGEPKEKGFYFVAIAPNMPLADIQTTALFYNPAARCRWMRGEKGNAERFEGEVIAHIKAPEYK